MVRRVACIALPQIRVEIAEASAGEGPGGAAVPRAQITQTKPLAVVIARAGGAVETERDVLGATKLDVVSPLAHARGARAGQTVATARAKCFDLRVRVVREDEVRSALERVAEAALGFGPSASFDVANDVVWVEVGGCAHLHGGETALAQAIEARVRALGHACRIAIADGPRVASCVARFASTKRPAGPMIVPEGRGAAAVRVLPIAALALDEDAHAWLEGLGLRACGALQKLPRRSLGTRLGARAHDVMQLLDGEDRAPLAAWRPPEVPEERVVLEWGVASVEALVFVVKTLCDRLGARLEGRGVAATRLDLVFELDRALCGETGSPLRADPRHAVSVVVPSPIVRAEDLCAVLRARLDREALPAPALAVVLRAAETARAAGRTLDLLTPEPKADRALPRLVAELAAEWGAERVGTLELVDAWTPHERTRLIPYGAPRPTCHHSLVTSALEPSRLVAGEPLPRSGLEPLPRSGLEGAELLVRVEAVEWWRSPASRRDWLAVWMPHVHHPHDTPCPRGAAPWHGVDAGVGALAWVELAFRDRGEDHEPVEAMLRGWMD